MNRISPNRGEGISGRVMQFFGSVSVRTKILGIVLALTLALGLAITWQVRMTTSGVLLTELDTAGISITSDLAGRSVDPILLDDTYALHELLHETLGNHEDVVYAFVEDPDGRILAHTFEGGGFPSQLADLEPGASPFVYDSAEGRIHDFAEPIFDGRAGTARVGLSEARLTNRVGAMTAQMLLTTLAVAAVGVAAAIFLTWLLTRPILDLVATTRRVGSGDLTARADPWAKDEIGVLAGAFNRMVEDLERSRATIEEKEIARTRLLDQLISAQEEERKRIARELHDGVGQALNSIALGISSVVQPGDSPVVRQQVEQLRGVTDETLNAVRQLGRDLRPSVLDDLGLVEALDHYAAEFNSGHPDLRVDAHLDLDRRLPPTVETAFYRMVQEGMTNAARHSGGEMVSLVVARHDGVAQAIIEDDGRGFDVDAVLKSGESVGIHGMQERAELVGGRVRFESGPTGTTVFIEVPS